MNFIIATKRHAAKKKVVVNSSYIESIEEDEDENGEYVRLIMSTGMIIRIEDEMDDVLKGIKWISRH